MTEQAESPNRPLTVNLTVRGRRLSLHVDVPTGNVRPAELLPLYRAVSEQMSAIAVRDAAAAGHRVSCRAGCGACCRQLVPVSTLEARELMKLLDAMPEPRRSQVRQRFAEARQRIQAAGLLDRLLAPDYGPGGSELAAEYWALRIPCPFLEEESCSIHPDRPLICREYLVVSPAEHCAEANPQNVRALTPPAGPVSARFPRYERAADGTVVHRVALSLAPDFVTAYPDEPPPGPAERFINSFFASGEKTLP
ncbi:MAG TPA: YkgJ family cysteine cluster protein [Tepidisphaeraceae bacterium]|nr:YkgJ family cysteine cluster protein [Tepidisphaeraceae bacterium]